MKNHGLPLLLALALIPSRAAVVINEIYYNGPDSLPELEYIELHNSSDQAADVSGWSFTKGIQLKFAPGTRIDAKGYLVVSRNPDLLREHFGAETAATFSQSLSNGGEAIELSDASGARVDSVKYQDGPPWPAGPDGNSASLERISPGAPGNSAHNWAGSALSDDGRRPMGTPGRQNENFSAVLPPIITDVRFRPVQPAPEQPVTVEAMVTDSTGIASVQVLYRAAGSGTQGEERTVTMRHVAGDRYAAEIPAQKTDQLIRFRLRAENSSKAHRFFPGPNEPRPALSYFVHGPFEAAKIPLGFIVNVGVKPFKAAQNYGRQSRQGMFSEEMQMRFMIERGLKSGIELGGAWFQITAAQPAGFEDLARLQPFFRGKVAERDRLIEETLQAPDVKERVQTLPNLIAAFQKSFSEGLQPLLGEKAASFAEWQSRNTSNPQEWGPDRILKQVLDLEGAYFHVTSQTNLTAGQFPKIREVFIEATKERTGLTDTIKALMSGQGDFGDLQAKTEVINESVGRKLEGVLTTAQKRDLEQWRARNNSFMPGRGGSDEPEPPRGESAFVSVDPKSGRADVFDFVTVSSRNAGFKVRFHKDQPWRGLSTINLLFEYQDRFVLAEPLAYELYRRAGNAAPLADFIRLAIDGRTVGYHLWVEQPNRAFLERNRLNTDGNLYKILWYGQGVVGQHEKKTNPESGHDDILELIRLLETTKGEEQWAVIRKHFNVGQVMTYFAVNMCLSHWDGFFNNYFTYHDVKGTRKWEMYPWDQDKTWGFHDGLSEAEIFFDMPITFGMEGDAPPGWPKDRPPPRGMGQNPWWRPGGYFGKPLLSNPQFRKAFLARTKAILQNTYTAEVFGPILDDLKERLKVEIPIRATATQEAPDVASKRFEHNLELLRQHLVKRRQFLLDQPEIRAAEAFSPELLSE
jgi:hypothetical protein